MKYISGKSSSGYFFPLFTRSCRHFDMPFSGYTPKSAPLPTEQIQRLASMLPTTINDYYYPPSFLFLLKRDCDVNTNANIFVRFCLFYIHEIKKTSYTKRYIYIYAYFHVNIFFSPFCWKVMKFCLVYNDMKIIVGFE